MQGGSNPNARQKRWLNYLRSGGCINCPSEDPNIHHCVGTTAKHNKTPIGHDWILPLCYPCHQGPEGIHGNAELFRDYKNVLEQHNIEPSRKELEKLLFAAIVEMEKFNPDLPGPEIVTAIKTYRR